MKKTAVSLAILLSSLLSAGCTPEVGTQAWCTYMDKKAKGDWSANEAADYAKHCIFK